MPVTRNFYVSHQWLRELKRKGQRTLAAVYFRVPDEDLVWIGHYLEHHRSTTAAQAVALVLAADNPEGYQVLVPRRIPPTAITRTRILPQILGWRYYPGAHGRPPCTCPVCLRGEIRSRRLRVRPESDR